MTQIPTGRADSITDATDAGLDVVLDPTVQARLDAVGLPALITERTLAESARVSSALDDPAATASRAGYAAWLRRQAGAWTAVRLPAVHVAALDWPLASVRPQCLDVVGLIVADLRELCPRTRPSRVPVQGWPAETPPHGMIVAAALLCVRVAHRSAGLLGPVLHLSDGITAAGTATRYLSRCQDLAERAAGVEREVTSWAGAADPTQLHLALLASTQLTRRLADALEAGSRTGW
ncbi:MAG TPA: hypothetical protein VI248_09100 [Kineosporiaceae bacterium]